jgi:hypothetical protein
LKGKDVKEFEYVHFIVTIFGIETFSTQGNVAIQKHPRQSVLHIPEVDTYSSYSGVNVHP